MLVSGVGLHKNRYRTIPKQITQLPPPPPYVVLLLVVGEDDGGVVDRRLHALRDGEVDAVVELPQEPVPVRLVPIMM